MMKTETASAGLDLPPGARVGIIAGGGSLPVEVAAGSAGQGYPLFIDPSTHLARIRQHDQEGSTFWRQHTSIVIVDENKRHQDDPERALGRKNARNGVWTPQFREIINSRIPGNHQIATALSDDQHAQILSSPKGNEYVPIVTPSNLQRLAFINAVTKSFRLLPGHYPIRLVSKVSESRSHCATESSQLTTKALSHLMAVPDC